MISQSELRQSAARFERWFADEVSAADADEAGLVLRAAGFAPQHLGGNCLGWAIELPDSLQAQITNEYLTLTAGPTDGACWTFTVYDTVHGCNVVEDEDGGSLQRAVARAAAWFSTFVKSQDVERLAAAFYTVLFSWLDRDALAMVRARNATPEYGDSGACASHDFCDANMAMAHAFVIVLGRKHDGDADADNALWNEAWSRAKARWLTAQGGAS